MKWQGRVAWAALMVVACVVAAGCSGRNGDPPPPPHTIIRIAPTEDSLVLSPESSIIFESSKVIDTRVGGFSDFWEHRHRKSDDSRHHPEHHIPGEGQRAYRKEARGRG